LTNTDTNTTSAPLVGTRQSTAHDITADTGRRIKPVVGLESGAVPTVQFQQDTLAETNRIFPPGKYQDRLCVCTYLPLPEGNPFPNVTPGSAGSWKYDGKCNAIQVLQKLT
jgi:hypothetical protein